MASADDEEELLRSVALQNAQSVLHARQLAEQALVSAKEALERKTTELAHSLAMMRATLESTTDGILVTTGDGKVADFNLQYLETWRVPLEAIATRDHRVLLAVLSRQFADPPRFLARIEEIYATAPLETYDLLDLADGRAIERFSRIQFVAGLNSGRVWSFRDVTEQRQAEEAMKERAELAALRADVAGVLAESRDLQSILQRCAEILVQRLAVAFARIWTLNEAADVLELQASAGLYTHRDGPHGRIKVGEFKVGQIAKACRPLLTNDVPTDARISDPEWARREGMVAFAGYPLLVEGRCVGVVGMFSRRPLTEGILSELAPLADGIAQCVVRKASEAALLESEARKTAILETSLDAIITCDHEGVIQEFNPAAERMFGFPRATMIGNDMAHLIVPTRLRDSHRRGMADYLATGHGPILNRRVEMAALRSDGVEFPCELAITPIIGRGQPLFTAHVRDITDRKQAQHALQKQTEWLRVTLLSIGDAVITTDAAGRVTSMNPVAVAMTGWSQADAKGLLLTDVFHIVNEETRQPVESPATKALEEGRIVGLANHTILIARDGSERAIDDSAAPIRDDRGTVIGVVLIFRDITERRRDEETIRFLAEASATLSELTDYKSTLQKVASIAVPRFADWCAVDMQESDGSVRRLAVTHIDPSKVVLAQDLHRRYPPSPTDSAGIMKVLRTGEVDWAPEIPEALLVAGARDEEHLRLARELGLKSYICVPLRSRSRTLGALTFVTAESGRVYDAADVRAAEDLAHRAVIAIENAKLLAALKDSDRRKDEFLAMLAHELRNPLAPIRNAVQIYRGKGPPVPELQWATNVIDRQVHQMTRLVDDLLDVSRITRGKIELRRERVELAAIVNSAVEASRPLIDKWGHELTVTIPPEPIYLDVDFTRFSQVVLNLLNNAAKYTDQGGRIWLTAGQEGGSVVIRVKDNGIGISQEMLARVFEMFAQEDRSLERSRGGLGIGLTLVHRLVEMQGGTTEARSEGLNKGSEFIVRMPAARRSTVGGTQDASQHGDDMVVPTKHRILVVDDNRDAADSLGMLLRMMGNEVKTAHDGLEAVGAAAGFRPDVILLDIGLPKLNGYEVARRIREQSGGDKIVLIALTGWGQDEDRRRTKEAGFDQHMTKPVEFDALKRALAALPSNRPS